MTVKELTEKLGLKEFVLCDPDREITGGYAGDLLSWVMGRASEGDAWITIMTNLNVIAVASLADTACVILAEGVTPDQELCGIAKDKCINLLGGEDSTFELCAAVKAII